MWCGCWRASGFAWCVRSQVVGIATRRGARDETAARPARARAYGARARPAHARSAQAMRLTANTKRKQCNYKVRIEYVGLTIPDKTLDRLTCMKR